MIEPNDLLTYISQLIEYNADDDLNMLKETLKTMINEIDKQFNDIQKMIEIGAKKIGAKK